MTPEERKKLPEIIEIESIKVLKGNISCPEDFDHELLNSFQTEFEISQGINIDIENFRFLFTARFVAIGEHQNALLLSAEYTIEFIFHINGLEKFITELDPEKNLDKENKVYSIDGEMGVTLISIVYSTARGLILARTQGTVIANGIIIPVIDPATLVPLLGLGVEQHKLQNK